MATAGSVFGQGFQGGLRGAIKDAGGVIPGVEVTLTNEQTNVKRSSVTNERGEWVAWSPDGIRLVATSRDPDSLDDLIRAAGEDPENCVVEGIPDADCVLGGMDVS